MAYTAPSVTTSGLNFASFQAAGLNGLLEALVTANNSPTLAPTAAATLAASGSGGTLPAATYYVEVTESNGLGETTAGPISASQAVTLGQNLVTTFAALKSGNVSRRVYAGTSSVAGKNPLVAEGITASTYTISTPLATNSLSAIYPPTVNSTGLTSGGRPERIQTVKKPESRNLQDVWTRLGNLVANFNRGEPVNYQQALTALTDCHVAFAFYSQACTEIGTLMAANPGTIHNSTNGIGNPKLKRQWP